MGKAGFYPVGSRIIVISNSVEALQCDYLSSVVTIRGGIFIGIIARIMSI